MSPKEYNNINIAIADKAQHINIMSTKPLSPAELTSTSDYETNLHLHEIKEEIKQSSADSAAKELRFAGRKSIRTAGDAFLLKVMGKDGGHGPALNAKQVIKAPGPFEVPEQEEDEVPEGAQESNRPKADTAQDQRDAPAEP